MKAKIVGLIIGVFLLTSCATGGPQTALPDPDLAQGGGGTSSSGSSGGASNSAATNTQGQTGSNSPGVGAGLQARANSATAPKNTCGPEPCLVTCVVQDGSLPKPVWQGKDGEDATGAKKCETGTIPMVNGTAKEHGKRRAGQDELDETRATNTKAVDAADGAWCHDPSTDIVGTATVRCVPRSWIASAGNGLATRESMAPKDESVTSGERVMLRQTDAAESAALRQTRKQRREHHAGSSTDYNATSKAAEEQLLGRAFRAEYVDAYQYQYVDTNPTFSPDFKEEDGSPVEWLAYTAIGAGIGAGGGCGIGWGARSGGIDSDGDYEASGCGVGAAIGGAGGAVLGLGIWAIKKAVN